MTENSIKYFDLQVNGYAGFDFNSLKLTIDQMEKVCEKLKEDDVEGILVTIITDEINNMISKIQNVAQIIESNRGVNEFIKGIHIEGPFLNADKGYRGAHPEKWILPADIETAKKLLNAGNGNVKLFTLAPENDTNFNVIEYLTSHDILVSAGHSNANMEELKGAIDSGLKMFTHLGNGTPSVLPRHDNIINRALSLSDQLYIGFIADGIHIPDFALKNYLKVAGPDRIIIVSDAMSAASAPPGNYSVSGIKVTVGNDRIVREKGKDNLAGSAVTMKESRKFLVERVGLNENYIIKILSENAKQLLKLN